MPDRYPILLPLPLDGTFDYAAPGGADGAGDLFADAGEQTGDLMPGTLVQVPLGKRMVTGVVWDKPLGNNQRADITKLKPIESVAHPIPLSGDAMALLEFIADYTITPWGLVLRMFLSTPSALEPAPTRLAISAGAGTADKPPSSAKITPGRQKVLDTLGRLSAQSQEPSVADLARAAGVSDAVVRGMLDKGLLSGYQTAVDAPFIAPDPDTSGPTLRAEQQRASDTLSDAVRDGINASAFAPFLLHGVTGSGKTEVYFEAIATALRTDPQAQILVLVPEIGLTTQWLERFEARFGVRPGEWHSGVTGAGKRRLWRAVLENGARVVVGARSSLFLPFQTLKLIIVDEEHDPSYKQEDGITYHARDMAVVRARAAGCPVVLASATPSLESRENVAQGRYHLIELKDRHGGAQLPTIEPIDMRAAGLSATQWMSALLIKAVTEAVERGEQALLYLNRRGYAPLTLCRTCGHRMQCPDCDTWLVEHRFEKRLRCHQCGFSMPTPDTCPECGSEETLVACGPGTERLFEEVVEHFPDARVAVLTSDTLMGAGEMKRVVSQIEAGDVDIVIGTQLITKGYHFPSLTVVGVIDADLGLRGGDLRAGERTWQQLVQVAGRAGRADKAGRVYLQTYEPQHPVIEALVRGDEEGFLKLEARDRAHSHMPPFGRLAAIILSGPDARLVGEQGQILARAAHGTLDKKGIRLFGPTPAPIARLKGQHRMRLLLHGDKSALLQPAIVEWMDRVRMVKGVRIKLDIDPYSFL